MAEGDGVGLPPGAGAGTGTGRGRTLPLERSWVPASSDVKLLDLQMTSSCRVSVTRVVGPHKSRLCITSCLSQPLQSPRPYLPTYPVLLLVMWEEEER